MIDPEKIRIIYEKRNKIYNVVKLYDEKRSSKVGDFVGFISKEDRNSIRETSETESEYRIRVYNHVKSNS